MNLRFKLSARLMLMLCFAVPAAMLAIIGGSVTRSNAQIVPVKLSQQASPFISQSARHDTLGDLNKVPIGSIIHSDDGGTGKESSEKDKESCEKCKESCESGSCGGLNNPFDIRVLPTADTMLNPQQVQHIQQKELLKTSKPIF